MPHALISPLYAFYACILLPEKFATFLLLRGEVSVMPNFLLMPFLIPQLHLEDWQYLDLTDPSANPHSHLPDLARSENSSEDKAIYRTPLKATCRMWHILIRIPDVI
jgi:hypothetical protein